MGALIVRVSASCNEAVGARKRVGSASVNLVNVETPIKKTSKRIDRSLLNDDIEAADVRLVAADGSQRGVVPRAEALAEARQAGLDLVLVVADATPPVCKVMDYGKHLFELKKTKAAHYLMDDIVLIYFAIMMMKIGKNLVMDLSILGMVK